MNLKTAISLLVLLSDGYSESIGFPLLLNLLIIDRLIALTLKSRVLSALTLSVMLIVIPSSAAKSVYTYAVFHLSI